MKNKFLFLFTIVLVPGFVSFSIAEMKGDPASGKTIFEKNCVTCHGAEGKGDGPAAIALNPKPKSFIDPIIVAKPDKELFDTITKGRPGTPMTSYEKILSEQQRWDVLAHIRSFGEKK